MLAPKNNAGLYWIKKSPSYATLPIILFGGLLPLIVLIALSSIAINPALAQEPLKLEMPLRCSQGSDCWIVNYVDIDPTPKVKGHL